MRLPRVRLRNLVGDRHEGIFHGEDHWCRFFLPRKNELTPVPFQPIDVIAFVALIGESVLRRSRGRRSEQCGHRRGAGNDTVAQPFSGRLRTMPCYFNSSYCSISRLKQGLQSP